MPDAENLPATTSAPATPPARVSTPVHSAVDVLDTAKFEHMYRIARGLATTSVVPQSLVCEKQGSNWVPLPPEVAIGNCFMVVEQAVRWGMSPFAVAQCASVVHGKLMFEGKLVHAALEQLLGVRLQYAYNDRTGDQFGITVLGQLPGEDFVREVTGTVAEWKPAGDKSPWQHAANHRRMLVYRGTREWARLHAPGVLLGVYTADEIDEDPSADRAAPALQRSLTPRLPPHLPPSLTSRATRP